jgi:hypothetical protein
MDTAFSEVGLDVLHIERVAIFWAERDEPDIGS